MRIGSMQKRILSLMFNQEEHKKTWTTKDLVSYIDGAHRVSVGRALRQLEAKGLVEKQTTMPYGAGSRWEYEYFIRGTSPRESRPWFDKVHEYCKAEAAKINGRKTSIPNIEKIQNALMLEPDLVERLAIIIIQELHND